MNQVTVMFKKADVIKAGGYLDWHHEEDYLFVAKNVSSEL